MMKEIELTNGKVAIVDDEDYEWLSQWKWLCTHKGYAARCVRIKNGNPITVYMHREIIGPPDGMFTDHINHDKLDNRRENLRVCTMSQNNANIPKRKNNSSGRKGVYWREDAKKWIAQISPGGTRINLGYFSDINDASCAYKNAAEKYFGDFACSE
jgi:hypothetical protein